MSAPDEALRARLRALASHEALPQLDEVTRARSAARARAQIASERARKRWAWGLLAAACLPLAYLAAGALHAPTSSFVAQHSQPPSEHTLASGAQPHPAAAACRAQATLAFVRVDGLGEARLDLGARALLVATPQARVEAALAATCDLRTALREGSLAVHARDLRGAALIVATPRGEVRVKGTVFQVDFTAATGTLHVGVEEGRVLVQLESGEAIELLSGQALRVAQTTHTRAPFSPQARARLRRTLGLAHATRAVSAPAADPPVAEAPAAEPLQPLAPESVRAWRAGNLAPPALSPEPGSSVTPEGRPMEKPKLVRPTPAPNGRDNPGDAP